MTQQRAGEIERAVFGKYLEKMKKDLDEADTSIVFEVGRTIGFMQNSLYDELRKEVEHHDKLKEAVGKIRGEIKEWYFNVDKQAAAKDPCVVDAMTDMFIRTINKHTEGLV